MLSIYPSVGRGPTALAVGAGGVVGTSFLLSFSLSLRDGPVLTEILSQRATKPYTTNQPTNRFHVIRISSF